MPTPASDPALGTVSDPFPGTALGPVLGPAVAPSDGTAFGAGRGTVPGLVLGRRRPVGRGAWPPHARLGNAVLARSLNRRAGTRLRDLGPMRAARRADLLDLDLADRRFGYPLEMVLRAALAGWRVTELDVAYRPRTGASKVTGTVGGTVRAVRDMRRVLARVAP
ncbi:hypothetical protein ACFQHO_46105 [Actinomadura yumaensis]|uniref:hypothetical protein n=1 Tax=Actinomadura yumaensis TaxID=111807 RepID=UPI0036080046